MKKRVISLLLAIVMLVSIMITPAAAVANQRGTYHASIPALDWSGEIHPAYDNREDANNDMTTIYVSEDDLPVKVRLNGENYHSTFELDKYDIYYLRVADEDDGRFVADLFLFVSIIGIPLIFCDPPYAYATVKIAPPEDNTMNNNKKALHSAPASTAAPEAKPATNNSSTDTSSPAPTPVSLEDRYKTVMKVLDLPFSHAEYTPYGKELKEFFTGDGWDGSNRSDIDPSDGYAGYIANRSIDCRTYRLHVTNLHNGKTFERTTNVDYLGNLETVPGVTPAQDYTLVVDRQNGIIEEWSLLQKRDAWNLDLQGATISDVFPLACGDDDDSRVMVNIDDATGQHIWSLLKDGKIAKLT